MAHSQEQLEQLRAFAAAGKAHNDSKILCSYHMLCIMSYVNSHPIGQRSSLHQKATPAMTIKEIEDVIERLCTRKYVDTGFDGVQIHAAHTAFFFS